MTTKLVVGPIEQGLRNNRVPFVIDNDSFPTLINAYQWRGRIKRKRGTALLTRLTRFFNSNSKSYSATATIALVGGSKNILTGFSLEANGNIVPGSVSIVDTVSGQTYTDLNKDGTLQGSGGGTGTINYATGVITITGGGVHTISAQFLYTPDLPVMGLRDFNNSSTQYPGTVAFDTAYSYNIQTVAPNASYDVSFYKNPLTGTYPGYIQKSVVTPTTWNGNDYQQFWTTNFQGALWATNGIAVPFNITKVGMQFKAITGVVINAVGPPAIATLTIASHGLFQGDFLFINEVVGITGINYQTGYVISADPQAANTVQVEFPNAVLGGAYASGGIAQYLTNRSSTTVDSLRWYDGDPTDGNATSPTLNGQNGWVNFAPPLVQTPGPAFSLANLPSAVYYLVGARMIVPFKDRLLFFGPVVQTSTGSPIYLQDTVIYSQNGTPYYTASWQGTDPRVPTSITPILTPGNETGFPAAYFEDSTGFGGFITSGLDEQILTVSPNEDVLIVGFATNQTRLFYSGNDITPFNFYLINSELGSSSTFSAINMDKGVITRGSRGYVITNQSGTDRIDLQIPDQVFEMRLVDNGAERFTAVRDYINEWIYFTYPNEDLPDPTYKFPTQTLMFNYRDNSWAIFNEAYTTYGQFRYTTGLGYTWLTIGLKYPTWEDWDDPWSAGVGTALQPNIIGGNQQGFVILRDVGTDEATSLYITGFSSSTVTSPDHCLNDGDFIIITGCIGTIGYQVNSQIFQVTQATENTFVLDPQISSGTYFGGGLITRLYVPQIQTKQFPLAWGDGRKTRIGAQRYLLNRTDFAQMQLLIFLSQNSASAYNQGNIVPTLGSVNNSLIYSSVLFTCPESTNLGLTPANSNLMTPTASQQSQLWHRINTSLIGDTVQLGFTISDDQMRALTPSLTQIFTITGATAANPCVLTCSSTLGVGQLVTISGVVGMTQLNGNTYVITAVSSTTIKIGVDSTAFTAYSSGGIATLVSPINQTAEIELHGFVIDVTPSQMLV
jgi:hypothetical protein